MGRQEQAWGNSAPKTVSPEAQAARAKRKAQRDKHRAELASKFAKKLAADEKAAAAKAVADAKAEAEVTKVKAEAAAAKAAELEKKGA